MKKTVVLLLTCVLMAATCLFAFSGCNKKAEYEKYFNNFSSAKEFTTASESLVLPEKVSIHSYDVKNDIFITKTEVVNPYGSSEEETMFLLGFASDKEVFCSPKYTGVIKIKGDYAIVTKPALGKDSENKNILTYRIGVIKFRNNEGGDTKDLTDFSVEYNSNYDQFAFVGDYIVCPGIKSAPSSLLAFSTFYDYSQDTLLEVFRVKCGSKYVFTINDGILAAVASNHAYFYELNSLQINGYLELNEKDFYYAFPEDTEGEYTDMITVSVFYLGNGWFSRTAKIQSEEVFVGYNMVLEDFDTYSGESTTYYANVRCDLYNVKTKTATQKEWLIVENVANKYNSDYYSELISYLQNISNFDGESGRYNYSLPYLNPASSIKDGYSIVYYYYLPYADSENYEAEISFCLMDDKANIIRLEDLLMPPVFVDGKGVQTSDPSYQNYYGSVNVYDMNLKEKELAAYLEKAYTYITYSCNNGAVVAYEYNLETETGAYGAIATDGKYLLPFEYEELTMFYGEYCIGVKKEGSAYINYRVDKSGNKVLLSDVVNIREGVYVFQSNGKLGLKNFAGNILIDAKYEKLDVLETVMERGSYLSSRVVATNNGITTIFNIK